MTSTVGWFGIWLSLTVMHAVISYWTWPGVKWFLQLFLRHPLPDPTIAQLFLLWFFIKAFIYDGFSKEAARQADKDRALAIIQARAALETPGVSRKCKEEISDGAK